MAWFRLDDRGAFHRKVCAAGNEAYGAWVRAGQWSSGEGTEGLIPRAVALTVAPLKVWLHLVRCGLLDADGEDFRIHDFLDWNPTAAEVERKRSARAEAGRIGGRIKAERIAMAKQGSPSVVANDLAIASPVPEQKPSKPAAKLCPDPDPDPVPRREDPNTSGVGLFSARAFSGEWAKAAAALVMASGEPVDAAAEWPKFLDHREAKGSAVSLADWRNWIRRACEFSKRDRVREAERRDASRSGPARAGRFVQPLGDLEIPEGMR